MNQEDADGHHGADRVQHHRDDQGAGQYFERFALKSKKKNPATRYFDEKKYYNCFKSSNAKTLETGWSAKHFTKHLNAYI